MSDIIQKTVDEYNRYVRVVNIQMVLMDSIVNEYHTLLADTVGMDIDQLLNEDEIDIDCDDEFDHVLIEIINRLRVINELSTAILAVDKYTVSVLISKYSFWFNSDDYAILLDWTTK